MTGHPTSVSAPRTCSLEDCAAALYGRGYCRSHYRRFMRHGDPLGGQPDRSGPLIDRLMARIDKDGPTQPHMDTPCWEWTGPKNRQGYGQFHVDGRDSKYAMVHRLVYEHESGNIPVGKCLLHECDFPSCCNPEHLRPGTHGDNADDKVTRGRQASGEGHGRAKLNKDQVLRIRSSSMSDRALARRYGVTDGLIWQVRHGYIWKHVGGELARTSRTGKLTPSDRQTIRALRGKASQKEVADLFDISVSYVSKIQTGKISVSLST